MGTVLRCHLTGEEPDAGIPATVIVKLPGTNAGNLHMSRRLQMFRREYDYYTLAAPLSPVRSPALLYGDFDSGSNRFVLVLEDLKEMQTLSQLEGASAAQARIALRTLARLHGTFWNRGDQPPLNRIYDVLATRRRAALQLAYLANLPPDARTVRQPLFALDARPGPSLRTPHRRPHRRGRSRTQNADPR